MFDHHVILWHEDCENEVCILIYRVKLNVVFNLCVLT